jgi:nitroimidazol reductase NimA-like FMN-containing flavoprotein (pyridoxamine 5'-phosphate oxidase superfamily)
MNNKDLINRVIEKALYCHLACSYEDVPYLVPVAFGYDGEYIYIHTGKSGKKIDILSKNPRVCLGFEIDVSLQKDPDTACEWGFDFQSVIASGFIEEIINDEDKKSGLSIIMAHYSDNGWEFPPQQLDRTKVWRINISDITWKDAS